ncbi:MAG: efflux RND transporter periplasmic adaptor subunit [Bryobacteraceae bacterium]
MALSACSGPYSNPSVAANNSGKPVSVRVQAARLQTIPEIITATGELFAEDVATLSAKVPGRVLRLNVDLGTRVELGQVVAELEKDDYEFRVNQAVAQVEQTRARLGIGSASTDDVKPDETAIVRQAAASLREATLLHGNTTQLFKQGVVSKVDFERAGVVLQAAQARHQAAVEEVHQLRAQLTERRAQLALARQQLSDTVIRAPFRGAVTRRQATLGEYIAVNAPVAILVRSHPLRIRLEVPERLAGKVRAGQRIDLRLEGAGLARSGRVVRLSPAIEAQNRSLLVEGEIPNEDGALRAGSFVEGVITIDPNAKGIALPSTALLNFAGTERVYVADNGALAERVVKTGRRLDERTVEVITGLRSGELVVIEPDSRLSPGQKVTPTGL